MSKLNITVEQKHIKDNPNNTHIVVTDNITDCFGEGSDMAVAMMDYLHTVLTWLSKTKQYDLILDTNTLIQAKIMEQYFGGEAIL